MDQWKTQLPDLVEAFLAFKAHGPLVSEPNDAGRWHIEVIDIESTYQFLFTRYSNLLGTIARSLHPFTHTQLAPFASVTLILHGYLGASPEQPHLAFSFPLLSFYQQLRRVHPRFSFDAFAKCLNHFHSVSKGAVRMCERSHVSNRSHTARTWLISLATHMTATWLFYERPIEGYPLSSDVRTRSGLSRISVPRACIRPKMSRN